MSFALQLGGSLVAILLLAAFARWLKLGRTEPLDEQEAMREVAIAIPGFRPLRAEVSEDGRSAIVEGVGGDAKVVAHGAGWIVHSLSR